MSLAVVLVVEQYQLPIKVDNEQVFIVYIGSHGSVKICSIHSNFEIMVNFSLVLCEILLILLISNAELLALDKENHATLHVVHHDILKTWNPILIVDIIKLDVLIFDYLELSDGLVARNQALAVDMVVLLPDLFARVLVFHLAEKKDCLG